MSALAPKADIRQLRVNSDSSLGTTAEIVGYTAGAVVLHRQRPKADTGHRSQCVRIPESAAERLEKKLMPWTADDAERHAKKADSPNRQRMWTEIANSVLAETGDEGRAIREANAAVARDYAKSVRRL
jgi:hypothetical protein